MHRPTGHGTRGIAAALRGKEYNVVRVTAAGLHVMANVAPMRDPAMGSVVPMVRRVKERVARARRAKPVAWNSGSTSSSGG